MQEEMKERIYNLKSRLSHFHDKDFREGQLEALMWALKSNRKISVMCAPTGFGKSLVGVLAGMFHERFAYLCSSKQLQIQIETDFPEVEVMWGRNNFTCNRYPFLTAADCPHRSVNLQTCDEDTREDIKMCKAYCDYEMKKRRVLASKYQVLNYPYFLTEGNFIGRFSGYEFVVCDEADTVENALSSFIVLSISASVLRRLRLPKPKRKTATAKDSMEVWKEWAIKVNIIIKERVERIKVKLEYHKPEDQEFQYLQRELETLSTLLFKTEVFISYMDETWLFDEITDMNKKVKRWEFKPTWLSPEMTEQYFLRHSKRFLMFSATFPPMKVFAKMLGLHVGDIDYMETGGAFPVENRQVLLNPVGDLSFKTFDEDLPYVIDAIRDILSQHPDEKGVIHTVSYRLNNEVMKIGDSRLVTHSSDDKMEVLDSFLASNSNTVFVSPSSTRGLDLPHDKCRFQIICKAPFQSLKDKLVNSRVFGSQIGNYWYSSDMSQEIVQAVGRGVRSKDDYCVTYILDKQATGRIVSQRTLFPKYWIDACDIY